MNQDIRNGINHVIGYIAVRNNSGVFDKDLEIIRNTDYALKKWWSWFPGSTTTWGPRKVELQKHFFFTPLACQGATLIHEALHQIQYQQMGYWGFWWDYIYQHLRHGYGHNTLEIEARIHENRWRAVAGIPLING